MASLFSRIGKPAPNFTSAGNPAGQMRSQWGDMSAAQRMGQRMRTPSMGYQPPGLQQGGTPLARPPQSPPNLGGGGMSAAQGLMAPDPNYQPPPAVQQAQKQRNEEGLAAIDKYGEQYWKNPEYQKEKGIGKTPLGGGFAPAPAGSVRLSDGSLSTYSGTGPSGFAIPSTGQRPPPNPVGGGYGTRSLPTGSRLYAPGAMEEQRRKNAEMRKNNTGPFAPGNKRRGIPHGTGMPPSGMMY